MEYVVNDRFEIPEEIMKMTRKEIHAELAKIKKEEELRPAARRENLSCGIKFIL